MRISAIITTIEEYACPSLQEKWDNTGLQVGYASTECTGVLVCLDVTPAIVEEAIALGCNLIVSHHPLFFKPVKKLTGTSLVEATAMNAIAAGISIYSTHTAADSTVGGVSYTLAEKLGIKPLKTLASKTDNLTWLHAIVPTSHVSEVQAALFDAGAGKIGKYDCCSFNLEGQGTFRPLNGASPFVGEIGTTHLENETEINIVLPKELMGRVESVLKEVHPYQTPAYAFVPMLNSNPDLGLGVYGILEDEMYPSQFVEHVKNTLGCKMVRTTKVDLDADAKIRRVAICGGAGGEFTRTAISMGAQAYITADVRYHDFVDYRDQILLIDAGHYETEAPIKEKLKDVILAKHPDLKVLLTTNEDNPINYL